MQLLPPLHAGLFDFASLCYEHNIDPLVALEDDRIRDALYRKDDKEVERLIKTLF